MVLRLALIGVSALALSAADPVKLGRSTYLFIDNHWVDSLQNIVRTLNQPVRHPQNPVLRADQPWEDGMVVLQPGTVIYDEQEKIFKMWYEAPTNVRERHPSTYLCYATSRDGVNWEKPKLGVFEFRGSRANNIVLAAVQHGGNWFSHSVLKDDADPDPAHRYKVIFWDQSPLEGGYGFFVAFSPDGIRWRRHSNNPVVPASQSGDTGCVMWSPRDKQYVFFQKSAITPTRKVARMISKDFVHWEGGRLVLEPDPLDPPDTEFYGMSAFPYADRYIGMIWIFHTYPQRMDAQLASSFDAVHWDRVVPRRIFLPLGYQRNDYSGQSFDSEMLFPASRPVPFGDQLMIYYSGFNRTHNSFNNQSGIGLTTLRLDGFVSLDAAVTPGVVVTKPFIFDAARLAVNVREVSKGAGDPTLRAEIQDANGAPLAGYDLVRSDAVSSGVKTALSWNGKSDLSGMNGNPVRLKFVLNNVKFYSFHAE